MGNKSKFHVEPSEDVNHERNKPQHLPVIMSLQFFIILIVTAMSSVFISIIIRKFLFILPDSGDITVLHSAQPHMHVTHAQHTESSNQPSPSGWKKANKKSNHEFYTDLCSIERRCVSEITVDEFETEYRYKNPVILQFPNGAADWTNPELWTTNELLKAYGDWTVMLGSSLEIVRSGGSGSFRDSLEAFIENMHDVDPISGEMLYVFDRQFYNDSQLGRSISVPAYLEIDKNGQDDSIFFLGASGSGVSFHKHADAWNGVVFGHKRWFMYPITMTPPGGVYPGFTQQDWYHHIYPHLPTHLKPLECVQRPGEIMYLPESVYHATINLGDTIAIGIQKVHAMTQVEKLFYTENALMDSAKSAVQEEQLFWWEKYVETFEQLQKLLPGNAEVLMKLGAGYENIGDLEKARTATQEAIQIDPLFVIAKLNLAKIHNQLGEEDDAEVAFVSAQKLSPRLWDVYASYGDFLLQHGRLHDARDIYKQGVILRPDMLAFWEMLKYTQQRLGDVDGVMASEQQIKHVQAFLQGQDSF